ncbi:unnamed protein product [Cladocopium goreaui]|uniref:Uncharacterized protein n=1 Tax=Cladocopium goreaui TaxID=2562237 RepID=A0A9P1DNY1_9DINO|nr:unnamed protein product [Cladocopium goreaui]
MERLDQRCCTEAIELRAQLRCAQQRFVEQRQLREELRRELQVERSREKTGHAMSREICFLQSHVESLQTGCSLAADHALSVKDEVRSFQRRIEEIQRQSQQAKEEASGAQQAQRSCQEELTEVKSSIQRCRQETSQVQHELHVSESRLQKVKEDGEREAQKSLKRLQAKLKAALVQEEELKGRLEEMKARRAELQGEETTLKDRLLKQEEEFAKIREVFGVEGPQSSSLIFCEQVRTLLPDLSQLGGIPLETHQRILQEQSDVYRDALDKLGNFKQACQSTPMPPKDEPELEQALSEAVEAEEAQAQIQIQILELTQELELSTCKLQLLKDSLLTERGRKAEVSRSLRKIGKIQDRVPPTSPLWRKMELRCQLQQHQELLRRRFCALQKLQSLLPKLTPSGQDLKIKVQQLTLAVPSIPAVSCTDLTKEIESMEARLLELRQTDSHDWNSDALQRIAKSSASLHFLELASQRSTSALQETIHCLSGGLESSLVEGFVALLQSAASCETRIAPEVQQVLGAVRFTREQAAKEAARTSWELQQRPRHPEDAKLQSLQNACVTCAAKLAEISARLSLSNDRAEEEAVKELLCQEDALLQFSSRRCGLEGERRAALEAALRTREALSQRSARASLDARQAAQQARHRLEKAIEEATLELETLREELPAEVQRLQKSWEEKWQQQMEAHDSSQALSALRQRIKELKTQHVALVDATERKRSEESHVEVERREQEAELRSSALQQQQLQEAKRRKAQEVEKCRFGLWDVEQKISDATEARLVQLRRAEMRTQELTREHSMKMAEMKSEAQRELHTIRNSSRSLAKTIAEELETSDFDQALRRSGDLDQKSAELLQSASKQLSSLAAAGA